MKKLLLSLAALCMAATMSAQTLLNEGFENGIPSNWTLYNDNNTPYFSDFNGGAWVAINGMGNPGICAATTSYFTSAVQADRWMVTNQINIPSDGYALLFDALNYDGTYAETLTLKISTTDNQKSSFTTVATYVPSAEEWESFLVDLSNYAGQNIYIAFVDQSTDMYVLLVDNVQVGVAPVDQIKAVSANMPHYSAMNTVKQVSVTVKNKGVNPLTSFDAYYTVNGGTPTATENVTGLNIAYNQTYTYTFNAPFMEATEGDYTIDVFVSNPNGESDDESDNSASATTKVYDATGEVQRTVLLEHFTTGKCPQCPGGEERLEAGLAGKTGYIWLKHHAGYYTDEMTCPEDNSLLVFYNDGGGTYAPGAMYDRSVEFGDGSGQSPVQVPQQGPVNAAKLDAALEVPTFSSVAISNINFDPATRKLTCTVSGTTARLENPRISLYLMEDSLLYAQSGVSGKMHHMHVMRHAINDVWGEDIQSGDYSMNYEYIVPETYKVHKCKLIAFVSNYSTNVLNRRVANATQSEFINAPYVGIDEVANIVMNVYPNPTTSVVNVNAAETIREVRIINTIGQEVYSNTNVNSDALQVNTQNFAAGTYMVTVKTDSGIATSRLNVVR